MKTKLMVLGLALGLAPLAPAGDLAGHKFLVTSVRTGDTEVFVMNHDGSGKRQVVPAISKIGATFPNWSPDGK